MQLSLQGYNINCTRNQQCHNIIKILYKKLKYININGKSKYKYNFPKPVDKMLNNVKQVMIIFFLYILQDGTIEMGIPSIQLYPIHHLDGQECFPGDFVVSGAANVEENQQVCTNISSTHKFYSCFTSQKHDQNIQEQSRFIKIVQQKMVIS